MLESFWGCWRVFGIVEDFWGLLKILGIVEDFFEDVGVWLKLPNMPFLCCWNYPTRPEGAEALSPGHRPGLFCAQTCRPVRAKALKLVAIYKAFALTGRLADWHYTQGAALG